MTVFDLFMTDEVELLAVERGTVRGNSARSLGECLAIVKRRDGLTDGQVESAASNTTVHLRPEDYARLPHGVGDGLRIGGNDYYIQNVTVGRDYDTGRVEHMTLTMEPVSYV